MDGEKEVKDEVKDVKVQEPSPKTSEQSPQKPELTPEQEKWVDKIVHDKYTAKLAKDGDKAKEAQAKLDEQTKFIETLQTERLNASAKEHGLDVEKLKEAGIDTPEKIATYVQIFGEKGNVVDETPKQELKDDPKPDSGKSIGGTEAPSKAIDKYKAGFEEAARKKR